MRSGSPVSSVPVERAPPSVGTTADGDTNHRRPRRAPYCASPIARSVGGPTAPKRRFWTLAHPGERPSTRRMHHGFDDETRRRLEQQAAEPPEH